MESIKVKLTIAYDGAGYEGWQVQKTGIGVQQRIEEALGHFFPSVRRIHGSSRTDTGVHALGMIAHVEIPRQEFSMSVEKLPLALNARLPDDIRILEAQPCGPEFHARFDAVGKQYRYFVWNHRAQNPLLRRNAWQVPKPLNVARMREGARLLVGTHDFESFAAVRNYRMASTVRTVRRLGIRKAGPLITFLIEADGFLYKMCRGFVGTLVQLGLGKFQVKDVERMLLMKDRRVAGMSAPAHGLVLWKVFYKGEEAFRERGAG